MADERKRDDGRRFRALHWVFRVGNLGKTMRFYERVLGMRVLRHEEFAEGCEATCNGPYGGAWSKTMVGYEPEQTGCCLEITYNYGINSYQRGNDLNHLVLFCNPDEALAAARAEGSETKEEGGTNYVRDPDGVWYKLVDGGESERRLAVVSVNVADVGASLAFYQDALAFEKQGAVPGASEGGVVVGHTASEGGVAVGHTAGAMFVELCPASDPVEFKESKGRLATEVFDDADVTVLAAAVASTSGKVVHGPMTLPPHDEHLVIVEDPDGYEFCFVGAEGYARGSLSVTNTTIDWDERATRGADGAPIKKIELKGPMNNMVVAKDDDDFERILSDAREAGRGVVVDCMASWCKKCATLFPAVSEMSARHEGIVFVKLDIDECPDAAEDNEVFKVPTLLLFSSTGEVAARYEGSDAAAASEAVNKFVAGAAAEA